MKKPRRSARTNSEDSLSNIIEDTAALHDHDARSNLVRLVGSRELLHGQCAKPMYAHSRHRNVPSVVVAYTCEA